MQRISGGAVATFRAIGDIARLIIPPPAAPIRTADLWRTTCFELFVGDGGDSYREINLSPSGAWAAYRFDGYREAMREADASIEIEISHDNKQVILIAKIETKLPLPAHIGFSAVIEETDGITRYWATAFAPGEPDFHAAATRSLILDGVSAE